MNTIFAIYGISLMGIILHMFCHILKCWFVHYYVWFMDKRDDCTVGYISKLNWCKYSYFPIKADGETINTQDIYRQVIIEGGCKKQSYTDKKTGYKYYLGDDYEYEVYNMLRNIAIRIDKECTNETTIKEFKKVFMRGFMRNK